MFFLFFLENICCGYSLNFEVCHQGISNGYIQYTFSWRNKKSIVLSSIKNSLLRDQVPVLFVLAQLFLGNLIWLCEMIHSMQTWCLILEVSFRIAADDILKHLFLIYVDEIRLDIYRWFMFNFPCYWRLLSSADNLCKQFGPWSGLMFCRACSESKLFDTLMVFLKDFFWKS